MQELPLIPTTPSYRVGTTLAGGQFIFDLRWNARDVSWYMNIFTDNETPLRRSIKVVLGTLLGGRSALEDFPDGIIFAADLTGAGQEAGLDDLGTRVRVYFIPNTELVV